MNEPEDKALESPKAPAGSAPKHRSFALTASPPRPVREQVARGALIVGGFLFIMAGAALCFCPELYIGTAVCGGSSAWLGSRRQRLAGVLMFSVALVVGIVGYWQERG